VAWWSPSPLVWRDYMSTQGLLTHVAAADCFITLPHPALECGIVTAWWHGEVERDARMGVRHEDEHTNTCQEHPSP